MAQIIEDLTNGSIFGFVVAVEGLTNQQYQQLGVKDAVGEVMERKFGRCSHIHGILGDSHEAHLRLYTAGKLDTSTYVFDNPQEVNLDKKNLGLELLPKGIINRLSKNESSLVLMVSDSEYGLKFTKDKAGEIYSISDSLASKLRTKKRELGLNKEFLLLFCQGNKFYTPSGFKKQIKDLT